jgi:hypothetical protein
VLSLENLKGEGFETMTFPSRRPRDHNILFAVNYVDGSTAYLTISPKKLERGDHVAREIVRERQEKGEVPAGEIVSMKRVR